jgi:predicted negative regulator of RcsB-dependent stress response
MHVFICKIKEFLRKNTKNILIIGGIIILCLFIGFMLGNRKNVSSNGNTIDAIRNELDQTEKSKQDIEGTASDIKGTSTKLESSIGTATDASERFDQLINECQSIIDQIRKQPAGE